MQRKSSSSVRIFYPRFSRAEVVDKLREMARTLDKSLPLKSAVLFGSYAVGNFTVGSDVDVLIVYKGKPNEEAYAIAKRILDIPRLEPHVYSEGQYREMRQVIDKMTRNGIVLSGSFPP